VPYSENKWRDAWNTQERWKFQKFASNFVSLPHIQDWLAVKELKLENLIDPDCVFAPGHSGDFVAGSHIPKDFFSLKAFDKDILANKVFQTHYSLAPIELLATDANDWRDRILDRCEYTNISELWQLVDSFEKWDWQERQAKFIANSVRVYEFFNYDWWMPLWDLEFMQYWQNAPLLLRKDRHFYIEFVKALFYEVANDKNSAKNMKNACDPSWLRSSASRLLNGFDFVTRIRRFWNLKMTKQLPNGNFATYGMYRDQKEALKLYKSGFTMNGLTALYFFRELLKRSECKCLSNKLVSL
jgi:asparagine synthase (glutamine-hydrolysing)